MPDPRELPLRARIRAAVSLEPERAALVRRLGARSARRLDDLYFITAYAIDAVLERAGLQPGQVARARHAVVLGTGLGCLESDYAFDRWRKTPDGLGPSPRLFAYTLPNIALGEAAIRMGFEGENLVVTAGRVSALSALAVGADRVARGDAEVVIVVAADAAGPATAKLFALPPRSRVAAFALEGWSGADGPAVGAVPFASPRGPLEARARVETWGAPCPPPDEPLGLAGLAALFPALEARRDAAVRVRCPSGYGAAARIAGEAPST
jgi:hypothetical protein